MVEGVQLVQQLLRGLPRRGRDLPAAVQAATRAGHDLHVVVLARAALYLAHLPHKESMCIMSRHLHASPCAAPLLRFVDTPQNSAFLRYQTLQPTSCSGVKIANLCKDCSALQHMHGKRGSSSVTRLPTRKTSSSVQD